MSTDPVDSDHMEVKIDPLTLRLTFYLTSMNASVILEMSWKEVPVISRLSQIEVSYFSLASREMPHPYSMLSQQLVSMQGEIWLWLRSNRLPPALNVRLVNWLSMNYIVLFPVQQYSAVSIRLVVQSNSEFEIVKLINCKISLPAKLPSSLKFSMDRKPHQILSIAILEIVEQSPLYTPSIFMNLKIQPPNQFSLRQLKSENWTFSISILQIVSNSRQKVFDEILSYMKLELNRPKYDIGLKVEMAVLEV